MDPETPRLTYEWVSAHLVGLRGVALWADNRLDIQYASGNVSNPTNYTASGNLITWTTQLTVTNGTGTRIVSPDGTVSFSYSLTNAAGTYLTNLTFRGAPDDPADPQTVTNGTQTLAISTIADGHTQLQASFDLSSGILTDLQNYTYFDDHTYEITRMDGTTEAYTNSTCCGTGAYVDRDGVVTAYGYDARHRLITTTRLGITTSNVLDAAGNVLETWRYPTQGDPVRLSAATYDTAGRLITSTDALGYTTTNSYAFDQNGRFVTRTDYPNGSYREEYRNREGTTDRIVGTAVFPVRYVYEGCYGPYYTREIKLDANGNDTLERTITYPDFFGRNYLIAYNDGAQQQSDYDTATGQLVKEVDPDGVTTLYEYNVRGEVEATGTDLDGNGTLTSAVDRRTRTVTDYWAKPGADNVRRTRTFVWTDAGSELCVATNEVSVTGTNTWYSSFGRTTQTQTHYGANGARTVTTTAPDGSYTVQTYLDGQLQSVARYTAGGQEQIAGTSYSYDAHGRQATVTDTATSRVTTFYYNAADQVVTNVVSATGLADQVTVYAYDALGRLTNTVLPDATSVSQEYFANGLLQQTHGSRTYPVAYTYDAQGRMQTMTTWQDYAASSGAATTTWTYDGYRGFLTNKAYTDGNGVAYTYTDGGRLKTRAWARGNPRLLTTYTYGFDDAVNNNDYGDLVGVSYSNDPQSTPAITYGYDRQGRQTSASQGGTTVNRVYGDAGNLIAESYSGGPLDGLMVSNAYDGLLRRQQLTLNAQPSTLGYAFTYDGASRLLSASDGTHSATYDYLTGSSLVEHIYFTNNTTRVMTTSKSYDGLNRLTRIGSADGQGATLSSFGYALNTANQRTSVTNADSSYWVYGYDELGQVVSGKKYWSDGTPVAGQQFEYGFDDIGNREWTKAGGDNNGSNLRTADYDNNLLNQITSREVPGYVDIIGTATNTAIVTANLTASQRKGDYFRIEVPLTNSSGPAYATIETVGVISGGGGTNVDIVTTNTGNLLLPAAAEGLYYDADGNLTGDSLWTNTWNGENRLVATESANGVPTEGKKRETWTYLPDGRWIERVVSKWESGDYVPEATNRFVWDGQVLLAILDHTNGLVAGFMRGVDLSGTLQGAGGVGGLLAITTATNGTHFYCHDGNGNVTALVDADDGSVSALYEYDPFGNELRATGLMAKENPMRFSSQYKDDVTGDSKYLFREYRPSIGRWPNRDPIGEKASNLHCFVGNEPISAFDILGLVLIRQGDKLKLVKNGMEIGTLTVKEYVLKSWVSSFGAILKLDVDIKDKSNCRFLRWRQRLTFTDQKGRFQPNSNGITANNLLDPTPNDDDKEWYYANKQRIGSKDGLSDPFSDSPTIFRNRFYSAPDAPIKLLKLKFLYRLELVEVFTLDQKNRGTVIQVIEWGFESDALGRDQLLERKE